MSRSYKKNGWIQDSKDRNYWKTIRRVSKNFLRTGKEIPDKKTIIDDYNFRDYKFKITDKKYLRK